MYVRLDITTSPDEFKVEKVVDIIPVWCEENYEDEEDIEIPADEDDEVPVSKLERFKKLPAFIGKELILHDEYEGLGHDNDAGEFDSDEVYTMSFNSDKGFFTAEELVECIVEWEKIHRTAKTGEGQIDVCNIFLEGMGESSIPGSYVPYYGH